MAKSYLLTPDGKIKDRNTLGEVNGLDVVSTIGKFRQRPSEQITNPIITTGFLPDIFSNVDEMSSKKYIQGETNELTNTSFNFIKKENNTFNTKSENEFESVKYYRPYNSVFDLDIENTSDTGIQLFANELDFYGFSTELLRNPIEAVEETLLRLLTLVDMIIASAIPVATVSLLQFLLQSKVNELEDIEKKEGNANLINQLGKNLELGKYITYALLGKTSNNFFIKILEKTLDAFERLMNFPKFKLFSGELNIFKNLLVYFSLGYMSYLIPGFKVKIPNSLDLNQLGTFFSDLLTTLITSNSSRHPYNLLIRKTIRNNYFLKTTLDNNAIKTVENGEELFSYSYIRQLSILGSFFFRFIGERVAVGEKIFRIDYPNFVNKNTVTAFGASKLSETMSDAGLFVNDLKRNTSITSFRSSIINNTVGAIVSSNYSIFNQMKKNTNKIYDTSIPKLKRLNAEDVEKIENMINSEYMPFSIHDLRTNEVFSFHSFIESVSDSFSPDYVTSNGIGRMDPIKIYNSTTRSISVDFWLISTSPEDHDEMWYYINRLVSCIYPQWSKPDITNEENSKKIDMKFANPFTQIPVAPPMIRLRVGDLIKSNYSRRNIVKQFGIENIELVLKAPFTKSFDSSEDQPANIGNFNANALINYLSKYEFKILDPEFINIINKKFNDKFLKKSEGLLLLNYFIKSNKTDREFKLMSSSYHTFSDNDNAANINVQKFHDLIYEDANYAFEKVVNFKKKNFKIRSKSNTDYFHSSFIQNDYESQLSNIDKLYDIYEVDLQFKKSNEKNKERSEDNTIEIKFFLMNEWDRYFFENQRIERLDQKNFVENTQKFLFEQNYKINNLDREFPNAIINSYESTLGEGIAGFIKNINLNVDPEILWDIEENKIAPMAIKMQLQFDPIHDIPLGLDYKGEMRAGAYRVGEVNNKLFGKAVRDSLTIRNSRDENNRSNNGIDEIFKFK